MLRISLICFFIFLFSGNIHAQDSTYFTQRLCNCLANDSVQTADSLRYWIDKGANVNGICTLYSHQLRIGNLMGQVFSKVARPYNKISPKYKAVSENGSPLLAAYPDLNKIKILLSAGAKSDIKCNVCSGSKSSFLQFIVERRDSSVLRELKKYPVSFSSINLRNITDVPYIHSLIKSGADYKTIDIETLVQTNNCKALKFVFDSIYPMKEVMLNIDVYSGAKPITRISRTCLRDMGFSYSQLTGDGFWLETKPDSLLALLREGIDPNMHLRGQYSYSQPAGFPIVFLAFKKEVNYRVLDLAIEKKFDLNQSMDVHASFGSSDNACTPLGYAIEKQDTLLINYFLAKGANINACSKNGLKAIHHAIKTDNTALVKKIIQSGTDLLDDKTSRMPLKYARQTYAKQEIVALLEKETDLAKKLKTGKK